MLRDEQSILQAFRAKERREQLLDNLEELRLTNPAPSDAYELLYNEYSESITAADKDVSRYRQVVARQLADKRDEAADARGRLEALGSQFRTGALKKSHYEKALRALQPRISALDAQCERLDSLLAAQRADEVERIVAIPYPHVPAGRTQGSHRPLRAAIAAGLAAVAVLAGAYVGWPHVRGFLASEEGEATRPVLLAAGQRIDVASGTVSDSGGTLSVSGTGGPLDGLTLQLPPASYEAPVTFTLGYSPIKEITVRDGVKAISPLLHVDADTDAYSDNVVTIVVPVDVPEGHFAMGFAYDEARQMLLPIPTIEESDGALVVMARHFCPIIMLSAPVDRFLSKPADSLSFEALNIGTAFTPGRDTWNLVNAGSCVASGGYCHGMSLTSLYYHLVEEQISGEPLWRDEYDNGLPEGMGTPGFWQDDRWAIELCSAANRLGTTKEAGSVMDGIAARVDKLAPELKLKNLERQFYMTAFALYLTEAPQLLDIRDSTTGSGHSLLCYHVSGSSLSVADPNYPDRKDLTIQFEEGRLGPYESAQTVQDLLQGHSVTYDRVYYQGDVSFFDVGTLEVLWTAYDSGRLEVGFPQYEILMTGLDDQGQAVGTKVLNRAIANTSGTAGVEFSLDAPFEGRMTIYEYGATPRVIDGNEVTIDESGTYIGFLVQQRQGDRWQWAGFDWVHVGVQTGTPATDTPAASDSSLKFCTVRLAFDGVFRDKTTGETVSEYAQLVKSSYGAFTGNTFIANWETSAYEGTPYAIAHSGYFTVTVDPVTRVVEELVFLDEEVRPCNGLRRHGFSCGGLTSYSGGLDENHLFCGGVVTSDMPPAEVTWEERNPDPGEDCPGGYAHVTELISVANCQAYAMFYEKDPG